MEVEKELRLPNGFKSWWEVMQECPDADNLAPHQRFISITKSNPWIDGIIPADYPTHEVFEGDILTLKMRAFDELKELIPSKRELVEMHQSTYSCDMGGMYHQKIRDFIEQFINLT